MYTRVGIILIPALFVPNIRLLASALSSPSVSLRIHLYVYIEGSENIHVYPSLQLYLRLVVFDLRYTGIGLGADGQTQEEEVKEEFSKRCQT